MEKLMANNILYHEEKLVEKNKKILLSYQPKEPKQGLPYMKWDYTTREQRLGIKSNLLFNFAVIFTIIAFIGTLWTA